MIAKAAQTAGDTNTHMAIPRLMAKRGTHEISLRIRDRTALRCQSACRAAGQQRSQHESGYVAVPPELLPEVNGLRPLQMMDVLGRVRTGRSALMGHPVLDLIALN